MSATWLALGIVIAVLSALTAMVCTSLVCASRERIARDRFDPRSDDELAKDVRRAMREQDKR